MFDFISAARACKLTAEKCSEGIQSHLNRIENQIKNATKNGLTEIIYSFDYPYSDSIQTEFIQRAVQVILEENGYSIQELPSSSVNSIKISWGERKYIIRYIREHS